MLFAHQLRAFESHMVSNFPTHIRFETSCCFHMQLIFASISKVNIVVHLVGPGSGLEPLGNASGIVDLKPLGQVRAPASPLPMNTALN